MSSAQPAATFPEQNYINAKYGIKSWLLTRDHKRIAMLYLISVTVMFALGGLYAAAVRLELLTPGGDFLTAEAYNKAFSAHGIIMVFFFLIPAVPAIFGNFLIPIQVGAQDLAFPRINLFSWYLYILGALLGGAAIVVGGVDTGWTFYPPYSTLYSQTNVMLAGLGAFIAGFSSILTGLNFLVSIHKMRAPGLTWFRLPLFVWAHYATSIIMLLGTPVVAITITLLVVERLFGVGIFDPSIGGDPVLYQHLFWFYSHPAVYIMILPAMGVQSELIAAFAKRRIFGYSFVAFSSLAIAIIGFVVWGHHMFVSGQSMYAGLVFSILTMLVAIPSAVKTFNWAITMYKGSISYDTPMIYAIGFLGLFVIGGLTGLFLGAMGLDIHLHDTYFVVAHFHYIMVGGTVMGFMGALHFYWPKMSGRMYPDGWGRLSAMIIFVGFNLTFFPQFIAGYLGMPRRYYMYDPDFQIWNIMSSAGASILAVGYIMPLFYMAWSWKYGKPAGPNPWGAKGLEWQVQSPPTTFNFDEIPVVTEEAYDYDPELAEAEYVASLIEDDGFDSRLQADPTEPDQND